jgi:ATP-dependent Clp protease ATP-binding subunit ClpA
VVFDFLRPKQALAVFRKMLANVVAKLKSTHKIDLLISEDSQMALASLALKNLSMGGRGVGNALEETFVNPLSRELFRLDIVSGQIDCKIAVEGETCRLSLTKIPN